MNEQDAALILSHAPKLSHSTIRILVEQLGSCTAIIDAIRMNAPLPCVMKQESIQYITHHENEKGWQEDKRVALQADIQLIPLTSKRYPKKLRAIPNCPPLLYVQGVLPSFTEPTIAIIGTRNATIQGNDYALRFGRYLAEAGCIIVSGLARGIDTHAHIGSIEKGITIAAIGSGLLNLYPKENSALARKIAQSGAVISELPVKQAPSRFTFPDRNRIIAALSDALILIEAPEKSGAMITMELGIKYKKQLFALPSIPGNSAFAGNHKLIKQGLAKLVDHPEEVLQLFGKTKKEQPYLPKIIPTNDEQKILVELQNGPQNLEELSVKLQSSVQNLQATLVKLLLKKIILELPGKVFKMS